MKGRKKCFIQSYYLWKLTICRGCWQQKGAITSLLLLGCGTAGSQGAAKLEELGDPVLSMLCGLLQTGTKQQTEYEVPHSTYYRVNGILVFAYTTPVALPTRLTEQVGWRGTKAPAKCHS